MTATSYDETPSTFQREQKWLKIELVMEANQYCPPDAQSIITVLPSRIIIIFFCLG